MVASSYLTKIVLLRQYWSKQGRFYCVAGLAAVVVFVGFKPQQFIDLWLTGDQQGQILFSAGHYQKSAKAFTNTRWQAFSSYGAEEFEQAAILYSQFSSKQDDLAQANALAHGRNYLKARDAYKKILERDPQYNAAKANMVIVQSIIDEINRLSESQVSEPGEGSSELGDEPQTADGADRQQLIPKALEQLSSEQLLLDPSLNDMWLRQVQKNPARFLAQKFYMQLESPDKEGVGDD